MSEFERPGYRFGGWYVDPECTKRINPGGILPTTITIYDKWIPIVYTISYDNGGGINSRRNPRYVTVESGLIPLYPAYKKNMQFVGWRLNGKFIDVLPARITQNITLQAVFKNLPMVMFDTAGGGKIPPKITDEHGYLEPFRPPRRTGYRFLGWFIDEKRIIPFDFGIPLHKDTTLYAKWEIEFYRIIYHVEGGIASRKNPKIYSYFDEAIEFKPAKKKGCTFLGWFDQRGNPLNVIRRHSIGDKEVFARFQEEEG